MCADENDSDLDFNKRIIILIVVLGWVVGFIAIAILIICIKCKQKKDPVVNIKVKIGPKNDGLEQYVAPKSPPKKENRPT